MKERKLYWSMVNHIKYVKYVPKIYYFAHTHAPPGDPLRLQLIAQTALAPMLYELSESSVE